MKFLSLPREEVKVSKRIFSECKLEVDVPFKFLGLLD